MKDVLTQQTASMVPLTSLSPLMTGAMEPEEAPRKLSYSAVVVGLAMSMGAGGWMMTPQAQAATSAPLSHSALPVDFSDPSPALHAPTVKYEVKSGESLWQIGQTFQVEPSAIAALNNLPTDQALSAGQTLKIPAQASHAGSTSTVVPGPVVMNPTEAPLPSVSSLPSRSTPLAPPEREVAIADVSRPAQVVAAAVVASERLKQTAQEAGVQVSPSLASVTPIQVTAAARSNEGIPITVVPPEEIRPVEVETAALPPQSAPLPELPETLPLAPRSQRETETSASGETVALETLRQSPTVVATADQPIPLTVIPPVAAPPTPSVRPQVALAPSQQNDPYNASLPLDQRYRVQPGDTLNSIARNLAVSPEALKRANGLANPNQIRVDQELVVPAEQTVALAVPESTAIVKQAPALSQGDPFQQRIKAEVSPITETAPLAQPQVVATRPLPRPFNEPRQNLEQLQQRYAPQRGRTQFSTSPGANVIGAAPSGVQGYNNALQNAFGREVSPELPPLNTPDFPGMPGQFTGYMWPAQGVLTSGYGPRWGRMHRGIDIAGPIGTPIMAAASGEVVYAGWNSGGFGKLVKIRHGDGSVTYYAHNHRILVRRGDYVHQGQQVAEMGSTGRSTGPHLHFEIRPNGQAAVNPMALLPRNR